MPDTMNCKSSLQKILLNEYTDFLCSAKKINSNVLSPGVPYNKTEVTSEKEFDLLDKKEKLIFGPGAGSVSYKNPLQKTLVVFDYESFINSLPDSVQRGLKRCDFIVNSKDFPMIILNELSQSKNEFDKESHAIHQLSESLNSLLKCDSVRREFDNYSFKFCVFSNRHREINSPKGIADSFGLIFNLVNTGSTPAAFEDIPEISQLGFKYCKSSVIEIKETVKFWKS